MLLDSCGVVGFTRVRPGGSWVHPGSLGQQGSHWCRSVEQGSMGSLAFALGVVGFIQRR